MTCRSRTLIVWTIFRTFFGQFNGLFFGQFFKTIFFMLWRRLFGCFERSFNKASLRTKVASILFWSWHSKMRDSISISGDMLHNIHQIRFQTCVCTLSISTIENYWIQQTCFLNILDTKRRLKDFPWFFFCHFLEIIATFNPLKSIWTKQNKKRRDVLSFQHLFFVN